VVAIPLDYRSPSSQIVVGEDDTTPSALMRLASEWPSLQRSATNQDAGWGSLESVVLLTGDRGFESTSLQRRVNCELNFLDQGAAALYFRARFEPDRRNRLIEGGWLGIVTVFGLNPVMAALLGMLTGIGGGMTRD
jgi:hypothetical protein